MKSILAAATAATLALGLTTGAAFAQASQPQGQPQGQAPAAQHQTQQQKPAATPAATTKAQVVGVKDSLNVRSGPGTNNRVVGQLRAGETVTVTGTQHGWSQVSAGGTSGWVSSEFLRAVK